MSVARRLLFNELRNWVPIHSRSLCYNCSGHNVKIKDLFLELKSTRIASQPHLLKVAPICYSKVLSRFLSDQSPNKSEEDIQGKDNETQKKNLTSAERLKIITTQYGAFGMAFHITISLISLGMFYFLVYSGVDFKALFTWFGMETSSVATGASTFVVAYAVHKVFAPVRIGITFVSVPVLVRHFRKIGFFKQK